MSRLLKRRLALIVAACALAAGGTVAAIAATSSGSHPKHSHLPGGPGAADLSAAAGYLGIAPDELQAKLGAGKSLAQIAAATPGKSEEGLVSAIVASRRARLAAASAKVDKRVQSEVKRVPGRRLTSVIRGYLGINHVQIREQLRAGRTLAQVADSIPGKSASGLIAAIVAARQQRFAADVASHKLTHAQAATRSAGLTKRVTRLVNHVHVPPVHRRHAH